VDYFIGGGAGRACMKDLVVKSQTIDSTGAILSLIRRPKIVQTLHRSKKSRLELLFISEAHRSTTKSDGMWESPQWLA
jgi:hypothetical protein